MDAKNIPAFRWIESYAIPSPSRIAPPRRSEAYTYRAAGEPKAELACTVAPMRRPCICTVTAATTYSVD